MNKFIQAAEQRDEIMKRQDIYCPRCGERQYSLFGKLYTFAYNLCSDCDLTQEKDELIQAKADSIFALIEA